MCRLVFSVHFDLKKNEDVQTQSHWINLLQVSRICWNRMALEKPSLVGFKARHRRWEGIGGKARTCFVRGKFLVCFFFFFPEVYTSFRAIVIPIWQVCTPVTACKESRKHVGLLFLNINRKKHRGRQVGATIIVTMSLSWFCKLI